MGATYNVNHYRHWLNKNCGESFVSNKFFLKQLNQRYQCCSYLEHTPHTWFTLGWDDQDLPSTAVSGAQMAFPLIEIYSYLGSMGQVKNMFFFPPLCWIHFLSSSCDVVVLARIRLHCWCHFIYITISTTQFLFIGRRTFATVTWQL